MKTLAKIVNVKSNRVLWAQILASLFNFFNLVGIIFSRVITAVTLLSSCRCEAGKETLDLRFCEPIVCTKNPLVVKRSSTAHVHCHLLCVSFLSRPLSQIKLFCQIIFHYHHFKRIEMDHVWSWPGPIPFWRRKQIRCCLLLRNSLDKAFVDVLWLGLLQTYRTNSVSLYFVIKITLHIWLFV